MTAKAVLAPYVQEDEAGDSNKNNDVTNPTMADSRDSVVAEI